MPERQSRHPDNKLIDRMQDEAMGSGEHGRAGGNVNRDVGTRSELNEAAVEDSTERPVASDNPGKNAVQGPKTRANMPSQKD